MHESLPTAATLSRWLRHSGALPRGEVADLKVELEHKSVTSNLFFLTTTYTSDASNDLPRHLVVKLSLPSEVDYSPAEVEFYQELSHILGTPPLIRCIAALANDDGVRETLVLEDLRATHEHPPWPIPPSRTECEMAIDALAHVHAKCWEAPALGNTIGQLPTVQSLTTMLNGVISNVAGFMDAFGNSLTTDTRLIYDRVFSSPLKPWMRIASPKALTIIHGDAHTWNFLFPRTGTGDTFLIDWQLWHVDIGARDLAYFIAFHWHPDRRRELELPMLRRYHDALLAHGVTKYTPDDLLLDYRRSVVRNLTLPIILWSRGMKPEAWWNRLECAVSAYRDLDCEELL